LIVDDERELRDALADALRRHGFDVVTGSSRADALAGAGGVDLVLLDLGLPDGDALEICHEVAAAAPVIVISARGEEVDRVTALELGADDYLSKPFGSRELVARCRSVLRRAGSITNCVRVDDLAFDLDRLEVTCGGERVALTTKELELALAIAARRGGVVRREELAEEVWGAGRWTVARTLDVHMSSLRRKLDPDGRR
jgi:DNA-binding response OmpR family regulator